MVFALLYVPLPDCVVWLCYNDAGVSCSRLYIYVFGVVVSMGSGVFITFQGSLLHCGICLSGTLNTDMIFDPPYCDIIALVEHLRHLPLPCRNYIGIHMVCPHVHKSPLVILGVEVVAVVCVCVVVVVGVGVVGGCVVVVGVGVIVAVSCVVVVVVVGYCVVAVGVSAVVVVV